MPIVSHVCLSVIRPSVAPGLIAQKWAENLKNEAEWLNEKRNMVVGTDESFQSKLAEPSHEGYKDFPSATFYSRSGLPVEDIKAKHLDKVKSAFKKFKTSLDHAFATVEGVFAKRFKDAVDARQELYSEGMAKSTLPFTGARFQALGPAAIASLWLTKDPRSIGSLRGSDQVIDGGPYLICQGPKKAPLKAALTERLVQAGIAVTRSGYETTVITRHNQLTAETVQGFTDPAKDIIPFTAAGDSHIDFIVIDGELYLDIKVSIM